MAKKNNITTFDAVVKAYTAGYADNPHWLLVDGQTYEGVRVTSSYGYQLDTTAAMDVENDEGYQKSLAHLTNTVEGYEDAVFTIVFKTNSKQPHKDGFCKSFKVGNGNETSSVSSGIFGIGSLSKGGNPLQDFFAAAAIKGLQPDTQVAELRFELEKMRIEHEHEKQLEELEGSISNRIMGFAESNPDRVFDIIGSIAPIFGVALKNKMRTKPTVQTQQQQARSTESSQPAANGEPLYTLPITTNPRHLSSDGLLQQAHLLRSVRPDINFNILVEKIVALAQIEPNTFDMAIQMADMKIQEYQNQTTTEDDQTAD